MRQRPFYGFPVQKFRIGQFSTVFKNQIRYFSWKYTFFMHIGRFFCTIMVSFDEKSHLLHVFDGLFVAFCEKAPPSWGHPGASVDAFGRKS